MKRARGFTLIELLVAVGILAIIAVLGWRGLDSIVRARVALNADLDQSRGLQLAFAQMQSDCANIATSTIIGARTPVDAQAGSLTLIRSVYGENQPSRVQVVAYRVRDGVLTRRESIATRDLKELDDAWSAALSDQDTAPVVALQSDVSQMAIRSWANDGMGWRVGTSTTSQTTSTPATNPSSGNPSSGNPPSGNPSPSTPSPSSTGNVGPTSITGLEVALQLRNHTTSMVKVFLLGAV